MSEKLYLTGLTIKNAGKINAANFEFKNKNGLVKLVGMNEQGKSTALKCLNWALFGKPELPQDFKTHGARETEVRAKLGDLEIIRTINKNENLGLKILRNGTPVVNATESFIREFADKKCINPQPFMGKDSQSIYQYLCEYLKINTTDVDQKISELEENRLYKHHQIKAIGEPMPVEKVDPVDIASLSKQKEQVRDKLNKLYIENKKHNDELRAKYKKEQEINEADIRQFNIQQEQYADQISKATELLSELKNLGYSGNEIREWIDTLPAPQEEKQLVSLPEPEYIQEMPNDSELLEIDQRIENAVQINDKARAYQKYTDDVAKLEKLQAEYDMFDSQIKTKREERKKMFLQKLPVTGLELREDAAYHNGVHCDMWSGAEKLDIAIDLLIAENPKLRLIWVDDAEKIDSKMQKVIDIKVKKHDILALMAMVADIPEKENFEPGVFYIEEGELK